MTFLAGRRWSDWFVAGCLHLRLRVRPQTKSVDFHDAENRQRPCRMIIQHVKDPSSVCLAWVLLETLLNPSTVSQCHSSGRFSFLPVKNTCGDWYPPIGCRTKERHHPPGKVLGLQWPIRS
ncbi:hypothetical protein TNCV_769131 [Trichonephila clavipes]|nr:hypothetical protein TNCV_769131 [Trichonephila clavipes]